MNKGLREKKDEGHGKNLSMEYKENGPKIVRGQVYI